MDNLIKRNYDSIVKRGLITPQTTHSDFNKKIVEEFCEMQAEITTLKTKVIDDKFNKKAAIECVDIILAGINYLTHNGYNALELMEEKIQINETRED